MRYDNKPSKTTDLIFSHYKADPRYKNVWTITDSYILYKREVGDAALDSKIYVKLLKEIFWELSKDIIRHIKNVKLPHRLGDIGIRKRKNCRTYTKQRIDFKHFNETGEIIYHCNNHTNKYYFFWNWDNSLSKALFTNKNFYKFTPARGNDKVIGSRGLGAWIKYCSEDPTVKDYDALLKA